MTTSTFIRPSRYEWIAERSRDLDQISSYPVPPADRSSDERDAPFQAVLMRAGPVRLAAATNVLGGGWR